MTVSKVQLRPDKPLTMGIASSTIAQVALKSYT
jgi:hypothetical protein